MAISKLSVKVVPLTLELALQFREMASNRGERPLEVTRIKRLVRLLSQNALFTLFWGKYLKDGKWYRSNGRHSSYLLVACLQLLMTGQLDDISTRFVQEYLLKRGGEWWASSLEEIPRVKEKSISVAVEQCEAETVDDEIVIFNRWDARKSARTPEEELNIHARQHEELQGLSIKKINHALTGVTRAAKADPVAFGCEDGDEIRKLDAAGKGALLNIPGVREAVRWIIETVPEAALYKPVAGATVFAEVRAQYGPEMAESIVEHLMAAVEREDGNAAAWEAALARPRQRQTTESLIKKGRTLIRQIVDEIRPSLAG